MAPFSHAPVTSGLPQQADVLWLRRHVSDGPIPLKKGGLLRRRDISDSVCLIGGIEHYDGTRQVDQAALFYQFSLEKHVPADHLLRSIDRFVDLEQVRRDLAV